MMKWGKNILLWLSVTSMLASLISCVDQIVLNQTISKRQFLPEQIPTQYFLATVLFLCALIFLLCLRPTTVSYDNQTESLEKPPEDVGALETALNEINNLKGQVETLETTLSKKDSLADEIHGVLAMGSKDKHQLIIDLGINPDDTKAIGYLNATLGRLVNDKVIRGGVLGYQRI